ncbi:3'-5' exonuclease [Echinicola rosea]|uniref:3'-5' exonuclease n=1 Tax=Echinicola rosea TaxID=1807691 RepID=A0ABQ1V4J0_9BACT|nr:3'-5' exonuclease [Echinicola rosea]GGF35900.1 3'-5' exonuclease [Echinicola rosea]
MADFLSDLKHILFLDIETASSTERFDELSPRLQKEWINKANHLPNEEELAVEELYFEKAGIYAEFGRVVCVGLGYFLYDPGRDQLQFRTKAIAHEEEHDTLLELRAILEKKHWTLCAHNGKEFDFPYLCRRMLTNRVPLPEVLQMAGRKPWEIRHIDTLELWKFGDYKHYTRLELLAAIFDIPSSKDSIDGSEVNEVFYKQKDLKSISTYCLKDVEVTARIYLAYQGLPGDLKVDIVQQDEQHVN